MKILIDEEFKTADGESMNGLTFRIAVGQALQQLPLENTPNGPQPALLDSSKKIHMWRLSQKLFAHPEGEPFEISVEDAALIKTHIANVSHIPVQGCVWDTIDGVNEE